ncbi:MAG: sodium/solute symporter [Opitutaceae bacterium]|nr:sodium/solute symporter [Opitutaceae bacterium]
MITPVFASTVFGLDWRDALVVGLYLVAMIAIGLWFKWRESRGGGTEEYLLGNRGMPWWLVGIAYVMTLLSTNSLVAVPGEAFNHGLALSLRYLLAPFVGIAIFYLFIRFFFRSRVFTPFTYLEERFDRRVRALGSIAYVVIRLFYLALVLYSSALVLQTVAGWAVPASILVIGIVGLVYVYFGGAKALVWADFVQFLLLIGGLALIAGVCISRVDGGVAGIVRYALDHGRGFEAMQQPSFYELTPYVRLNLWLMLFVTVSDRMFFASADQLAVQRLLSTSSYRAAERSYWFSQLITLPTMLVLWFLGLAVFAYYGQHPVAGTRLTGDAALFRFVTTELPPFAPGLFIAACLGLIMSTLDAGFHSLATVVVKDIYGVFVNPRASEEQQLKLSRVLIAAVAFVAMALAFFVAVTAGKLASSFLETTVFWISFQGLLAMIFLIGVTSCRVTGGDILRAFAGASIVTVITLWLYVEGRGTARPMSFLFVAIPGEVALLVLGYLPALWRKRLPPEKTAGLTLFTLGSSGKAKPPSPSSP